MSWSYDASHSTNKDIVRFKIGDVNSSDELLSDETISARLTRYSSSVILASIDCVKAIIAQLARDVDHSNVGMSASRSQQVQHYKDLLVELKNESNAAAGCEFGGSSQSDKDAIESDSDYRQPPFMREGNDNLC